MFAYDEDGKKWQAEHHPFTQPKLEDVPLISSEPQKVKARAYDVVLNGVELGSGSIRNHDSKIQKKIFLILMTVLLILPMSSYAGHHNDKSIIFYLDMNVASEKEENLDKFVAYLSETVERTEPGTTYYKYFISADKTFFCLSPF